MASPERAAVLIPGTSYAARSAAVRTVLLRVLWLNLAVSLAKIVYGYASGAISILSDGFHSLTDAGANVIALTGLRLARHPPDEDHPYGHRKFETLAAGAIVVFLALVMIEVGRATLGRFRSAVPLEITLVSFAVMFATLAVNLLVVRVERRAGRKLSSELLLADARHTRSDVLTSLAVIAALAGSWAGFPILDPMAGLVVVGFIGYAGFEIAREATTILSDRIMISEDAVREAVLSVPGVLGCHRVRSRGSADHVFLDLHVWMDAAAPLAEAHSRSHEVKDQLMARFPQITDAIIHIEPPPKDWDQ